MTSVIPQEFRTMREMKSKEMNIKFILILASIMAMARVGIVSQGKAGGTNYKPQCGYYHYHYDDHVWHWHSKDCPIKQQP